MSPSAIIARADALLPHVVARLHVVAGMEATVLGLLRVVVGTVATVAARLRAAMTMTVTVAIVAMMMTAAIGAAAMIGVVTSVVMTAVTIGAVMTVVMVVVTVVATGGLTGPPPLMLIRSVKSARFMVILQVTAGGATPMIRRTIVIVIASVMTRVRILLHMVLIPIGIRTRVQLITLLLN
jgi:hypothetical protein